MNVWKALRSPLSLFLVVGLAFRAFLSADSFVAYAKGEVPLSRKADAVTSLDFDPPVLKRDYWTELLGTASLVSSLERILTVSTLTLVLRLKLLLLPTPRLLLTLFPILLQQSKLSA